MIELDKSTWPEIAEHVARRPVAVLPVGAQEQHGHHLPVGTDTYFAAALARDLAEHLDAVLMPALSYGNSWANDTFPGTISLSPQTLLHSVLDIADGLRRLGARGLVLVNGDFGNQSVLAVAAQQILADGRLRTLHVFYPGLTDAAAQHCVSRPAGGSLFHADEVETSLMLHLHPELVALERARSEYPDVPETFGAEAMHLGELSTSGTFGDPRPATAETGRLVFEHIRDRAVRLADAFVERLSE